MMPKEVFEVWRRRVLADINHGLGPTQAAADFMVEADARFEAVRARHPVDMARHQRDLMIELRRALGGDPAQPEPGTRSGHEEEPPAPASIARCRRL